MSPTTEPSSEPFAETFRLSPQQRRLFEIQRAFEGEGEAPRWCHAVVRISSALGTDALEIDSLVRAWDGVAARHEILRTVFPTIPGMRLPSQAISEGRSSLWLESRDLSTVAPSEHPRILDELLAAGGAGPVDLARGPLVRLRHVLGADTSGEGTSGDKTALLLITLPALLADRASLAVLVRELADASTTDPSTAGGADDEALQYADLAEWQNSFVEGEETEEGRAYWRQKLAEVNLDSLPLAQGEPTPRSHRSERAFRLDSGQRQALVDHARDCGVEVDHLLLALWALVIGQRLGQDDGESALATLGVSSAGRSYEGLENAIGPLAKTFPLACGVAEGWQGRTWGRSAAEIGTALAEAVEWQECLDWQGDSSGSGASSVPHCPIGFAVEERLVTAAARLELIDTRIDDEPFDLRLTVVRGGAGDGLELCFDHDPGRLSGQQVGHIAAAYHATLVRLLEEPRTALGDLPKLASEELRILVEEPNGRVADLPEATVLDLFEQQATKTPEHPAVAFGDETLTYAELDRCANQLAHALSGLGISAEDRVGVCLDRSPLMLVAVLGIWKAGGAYVALDPTFPAARLTVALDGVAVVLVDEVSKAALPAGLLEGEEGSADCGDRDRGDRDRGGRDRGGRDRGGRDRGVRGCGVLTLGEDALAAQTSIAAPARTTGPAHLAYVLYTSGSTGTPKGVAVSHHSLLNYALETCHELGALDEPLRFLNLTTLAADLGHTALFPPLISGGTSELMAYEQATDAVAFADFVERRQIDVVKITPAHLAALVAAGGASVLPRRSVILGGEAFTLAFADTLADLGAACELVNEYGPTEATVGSVVQRFHGRLAEPGPGTAVPIGRPMPNTRAYVLDRRLLPQPTGAEGELCLGGDCLARGYLDRPGETARRFVPDPLAGIPGARMYRTGDLARHLDGGVLDCLGRVDHQVKVRGFRVELGEVEAVCRSLDALREAVVLHEGQGGEARLTAYVVAEEGQTLDPQALEALVGELRQRLPDFMIPSRLVPLEALPLTVNGKIDRAALALLGGQQQVAKAPYVAPRTPLEETLAEIWAEALEVEGVGIDDNFFALGGDSIRSIRLRYLAQEKALHFSTQDLFRLPTIRQLTATVQGSTDEAALLEQVDTMSATEVDDLLAQMLEEGGVTT